jgi:hypothetical protein
MRKSISCDSFFFNGYTRPLINSYGRFLRYVAINNIHISKKVRQYALRLYFDRLKMYQNSNHQIGRHFANTVPK